MSETTFSFDPDAFRPITLADQEELFPILSGISEKSCEFAFGNLYCWKTHTGLLWQKAFGRVYFYYKDVDKLAFTLGEKEEDIPTPKELALVSAGMKKRSASGDYFVVPPCVIEKYPKEDWEKYFTVEAALEDELEYIYKVEDLRKLPGRILAKKRNLISQFHKSFPDAALQVIGEENLSIVAEIAKKWAGDHLLHFPEAGEDLFMEQKAIELTLADFEKLGAKGVLLEKDGQGIAFAVGFPITKKIWAEPFEKALPGYKGASQTILQALAELLSREGVQYLNREQDMGLEGLRHAKRSYQPEEILPSYRLNSKL